MKTFLISLFIASVLGASDFVTISSYQDYPTPSCKTGQKEYLIPKGTTAKVLQWGKLVLQGTNGIYAKIAMWDKVSVKIINGPLKGKQCQIDYLYLTLKK